MTERYKKYQMRKFDAWKDRVKKRLPYIVIEIYTAKLVGMHVNYEIEKGLGFVIQSINNPYYSLMDGGTLIPFKDKIAHECILEIQVNLMFKYSQTICVPFIDNFNRQQTA